MVAVFIRNMREVVGVDTDAVPAYKPRGEGEEVPFGLGGFEDFKCGDIELVKDDAKFIDKGDVEVALCVFDGFGCLGHFDARGQIGGLDDALIEGIDGSGGLRGAA